MAWRHWVGQGMVVAVLALTGARAEAGLYSGLYVFGDSLSDVGNDLMVTGGVLPSPAYYTDGTHVGRFTNGLNYADYLAAGLGLGLSPSVAGGGNGYAYGTARINSVAVGLPPTVLSFNRQVGSYVAGGAADPGALYVLWIGANDMSDLIDAAARAVATGGGAAVPGMIASGVGAVMDSLAGAVGGLASAGARHFLLPNLPNLSLTPEVRSVGNPGLSALAETISVVFNQSLAGVLGLDAFDVLDIHSLDVFAAQTRITLDPAAYGLSNVSDACYTGNIFGSGSPGVCSNPDDYLYWDNEHPTGALHALIGKLALAAVLPEPASGGLVLVALALIGCCSRRPQGCRIILHS